MKKKLISLALISAVTAGNAQADIQLNGFANIVGGITTSSDETISGFDDAFNFNQGSLFAIQASSDLGDGLGATVQILAKGQNDWEPEFNWAYLSYDATEDLRFLLGRQRIPFYMYSDFLDVSYAYPWIEPPKETVYGAPFDTFNGIGAIYNHAFGDVDMNFHGMYGRDDIDAAFGPVSIKDMVGIAITANYDWLTLRYGYFLLNSITIDNPFFNGTADNWRNAGYADIGDNFAVVDDPFVQKSFGFQMNFEKLSLVGEYVMTRPTDTALSSSNSYMIMGSFNITETVLIHATYDYSEDNANLFTQDIPFGISDQIDALKGMTEGFQLGGESEVSGVTVGVRYDFHDSAALKFEYRDFTDKNVSDNDAGLLRVALVTIF